MSDFCPISGDWKEQGIPNLARAFLIKFYWTLQNVRVAAFTVSELLCKKQQINTPPPHPTQIRVNTKISEVENKILDHAEYFNTQEFNKLTTENFAARVKQANLSEQKWFL